MEEAEKSNSICPKCNIIFECGISAGKNSCWCFAHPSLNLPDYGERCFCEQCLYELAAKQTMQEKKT